MPSLHHTRQHQAERSAACPAPLQSRVSRSCYPLATRHLLALHPKRLLNPCRPACVPVPLRFIRWTQDTFSAGGHKAELMPLLERATRELQDAAGGRYRGDVRYLRLWVQYVSAQPAPAPSSCC
jgi:hypothetical protein